MTNFVSNKKDISILHKYINKEGKLDYKKIEASNDYLQLINYTKNFITETASELEQFAFWLNAYNFSVIHSVILKLQKKGNWKGNTNLLKRIIFFVLKNHKVNGKWISLYSIENKILRKKFKDPRIHFAINCASSGCPVVPGMMFTGNTLNNYLDQLASIFINNKANVNLTGNNIYCSPIFKWYKKDFNGKNGIIRFIKKYYGKRLPDSVKVKYKKYDWKLNIA